MKRIVILITLFHIFTFQTLAQRKMQELDEEEAKKQEQLKQYENSKKGFDKDKLSFGGNIGGSFSNNSGFVMVQPMVGYFVAPKTIVGVGGTYIYQYNNFGGVKYSYNIYGPIVYARQQLLSSIFAHAEYAPINFPTYDAQLLKEKRVWANQLLLGGGYGSNRGVFLFALYDVLWNESSPYASPWVFRIGFMF